MRGVLDARLAILKGRGLPEQVTETAGEWMDWINALRMDLLCGYRLLLIRT